ncbi:MAG TPA: RNA-binding protein [Candidatus Limnocylindria bacterium]|nr:RNA-binding protein [Candidatus Limnocylindria bacterium]
MMNRGGINIYVSNVARTASEDQLKSLFSQYGEVTSVKIIKDKFTGEVRGFAFVEMVNTEEGKAAIQAVNGQTLEGQSLRVNEARPREDRGGNDRGPRRPFNRSPRF